MKSSQEQLKAFIGKIAVQESYRNDLSNPTDFETTKNTERIQILITIWRRATAV